MELDTQYTEDLLAELAEEAAQTPPPPQDEDALAMANRLGAEVNKLDALQAKLEIHMKKLAERRNAILGRELVDLMDERKIEAFVVDGRTFSVDNYYKASIPKEHSEEAHNWLENHNAGDLITYEIKVSFPKDSEDESTRLCDYIRQNFQMADVENKRGVPWARLTSWLKELWLSPDPKKVLPPLEIMGATVGRVVKIKDRK